MSETRDQHWQRRSPELAKRTKADLVALYRRMGGMGGTHPPEKWYKEELISSIVDMEWRRLPEEVKVTDPILFSHPCDVCGNGQGDPAHAAGGEHHYCYTFDPAGRLVPHREEPAIVTTLPPAAAPPRDDVAQQKRTLVMAKLLENGCVVTLGTLDSRRAFIDGIPELAALLVSQFTPEELDVIMDGAR
jgi:hypothetical protein